MVSFNGKNALSSNAMAQTVKTIGLTDCLDSGTVSALSYAYCGEHRQIYGRSFAI